MGTEDVETCVSGDIAFLNFDYKLVHNFSELPSIVTQAFFDNKNHHIFMIMKVLIQQVETRKSRQM